MNTPETNKLSEIKNEALDWFYKNRENYSFRNNRTPYRVWISETILQQTRMNAALEKMETFFSCFPDLHSLASAKEEEVLNAFKGLGYYNRARNLHKGAKFILSKYDNLPARYDQLLEIPSIGPYTAAAIASICYGENIPVIDGNIKRIFSRIFGLKHEIKDRKFINELNSLLLIMFNDDVAQPGDLNEALMEFGQKICKVRNSQCESCVIQNNCYAYKNNEVDKFPFIEKLKSKIMVNWKLYFFVNNKRVLLNKYHNFYLLKNHNGFPSIIEMNEKKIFSTHGYVYEKFLLTNDSHQFDKGARHTITNHQIRFMYCIIELSDFEADQIKDDDLFWSRFEEVENLLVSSGLYKTWNSVRSAMIARGGT